MIKNKIKRCLPFVSIALMLCLLAQLLPLPVLGATIPETALQEPVIKDGVKYFDVTMLTGNSGSVLGDKITANNAKYDIKLSGEIVGSLVFNKNSQYIEIVITNDVSVDVLWNCASKYASCTLNGEGVYKIPQLVQDNGKLQSFNAIWITGVKQINGLSGSYQNISVHDAKQMMASTANVVLLDVRNQSEYKLGHLYDSQLIPLYALENSTIHMTMEPPSTDDAFMLGVYKAAVNRFHLSAHADDPIIVYCKAGSRSAPACELLAEHGYTQVYDMVGGITEWMETKYPTYDPIHHVNVGVSNGKTTTVIEPWLLYTADCIPCQGLLDSGSTNTPSITIDDEIIQQNEDYEFTHTTIGIDGTIREFDTSNTLIWQQNEVAPNFKRAMSLTSITAVSLDGKTLQAYRLYVQVQHEDYIITINTMLEILDETTYSQSNTFMEYIPTGSKPITTVELVDFTTAVTLSDLFQSLAEVADDLGYVYEISKDDSLKVFAERYYTLADEAQLLSHTVTMQLSSYDKPILVNTAVIADASKSDWCEPLCILAVLGFCVGVYFSGFAPLYVFCIFYAVDVQDYGCTILCGIIDYLDEQRGNSGAATPHWIAAIQTSSWSGNLGRVWNDYYILGSYNDGYHAQLYAGDPYNQAVIVGIMNAPAHGDIWLHGYSYPGYYTDYQIWVSNDGTNWGNSPIYSSWIYDSTTTSRNIYGGYTNSNFRYISIVCYNTGYSCNLFVDHVSTTK